MLLKAGRFFEAFDQLPTGPAVLLVYPETGRPFHALDKTAQLRAAPSEERTKFGATWLIWATHSLEMHGQQGILVITMRGHEVRWLDGSVVRPIAAALLGAYCDG